MQVSTIELKDMQGTVADTTRILTAEENHILAAQADRRQFEVLYEKYYDQVLRFIYQRVETKDEALDITQQVFMQAMVALDHYQLRGFPFSSWLYRIALNEVNSRYRKLKKERVVNIDDVSISQVMEEISEHADSDREDALIAALQHLDEDEIQLIEFRFFEKRPFKEIAEIKELSESAIKMKVYRLLEKIKKIMTNK